tara:strand:- start:2507 stop:4969 length:2463 start_codon:yes stop_codon:yes gene_type:complete
MVKNRGVLLVVLLLFGVFVFAEPAIDFNANSVSNGSFTNKTTVEINITITESAIINLTYNWNGTNYTMYNDSLLLMMNFDNVSALGENNTHVFDISGKGNNGTTDNATAIQNGRYGGAFEFNGGNDVLQIPDITLPNAFTISLWWNISHDSAYRFAIAEDSTGSSTKIGHSNDGTNFFIRVVNDDSSDTSIALPTANEWHQIVVVRHDSDKVDLYVDGSAPIRLFSDAAQTGDSDWSVIGRGSSDIGQNLIGIVDEVRIWNRSFNNASVYQHYTSNLKKYDTNKWELYINQSKNATAGLDDGNYTYFTAVSNSSAGVNRTATRIITVDTIVPSLDLIYPVNNTNSSDAQLTINFSAVDLNLDSCYYTNDTNDLNVSIASCANLTSVTWAQGFHNVTIHVNDSVGNENQTTVSFNIDSHGPNITLLTPWNNSGNNYGNITFTFNTSDAHNVKNCSLLINDAVNLSNTSAVQDTWQNFTLYNLSIQHINWSINCTDDFNNTGGTTGWISQIIPAFNYLGNTTDLSGYNITNVTTFIIENPDVGFINFTQTLDLSSATDINTYVNISSNWIEINSTVLTQLNKTATLTLYDISFANPRILKDRELCPATICNKISYNNGVLVFNVTQFSAFSAENTPAVSTPAPASSGGGGGGGGASLSTPKTDETRQFSMYFLEGIDYPLNIDGEKGKIQILEITEEKIVVYLKNFDKKVEVKRGEITTFDVGQTRMSLEIVDIFGEKVRLDIKYGQIPQEDLLLDKKVEEKILDTDSVEITESFMDPLISKLTEKLHLNKDQLSSLLLVGIVIGMIISYKAFGKKGKRNRK